MDMDAPAQPHADPLAVFRLGSDGGGLADGHFREVVQLVRALPGRWYVERREDEFGFVSVLLVQDVEGADVPTFALSRIAAGFDLELRLGLGSRPLGTFRTVRRAVERVSDVAHAARDARDDPGEAGEVGARRATPAAVVRLLGAGAPR